MWKLKLILLFASWSIIECGVAKKSIAEKYIDLLPDDEKAHFYERVARRINNEVTSSMKPQESHLDLTDSELNKHSGYVQKVLKEEVENFNFGALEDDKGDVINQEEPIKDHGAMNRETVIENVMDLTLRAQDKVVNNQEKRKRRNGKENASKANETENVTPLSNPIISPATSATIPQKENVTDNKNETTINENTNQNSVLKKTVDNVNIKEKMLNVNESGQENIAKEIIETAQEEKKGGPLRTYNPIKKDMKSDDEKLQPGFEVFEVDPYVSPFKKVKNVQAKNDRESSLINTDDKKSLIHIPMYNYESKNVFYNPENRFAPHEEYEIRSERIHYLRKERRPSADFDYDIQIDDPKSMNRDNQGRNSGRVYEKNPFDLDYYYGRNFEDVKPISGEMWEGEMKSLINKARHVLQSNKEKEVIKTNKKDEDIYYENSKNLKTVEPYVDVMSDMVKTNNEDLYNYDWLGTTVDILAAIDKLIELSNKERTGQLMDPSDAELFSYVKYLYDNAKIQVAQSEHQSESGEKTDVLPRFLHDLIAIYDKEVDDEEKEGSHEWIDITDETGSYVADKKIIQYLSMSEKRLGIGDLQNFLISLQKALSPLHMALKEIASVITFTAQNWYEHLKRNFLKVINKQKILQLLAHITISSLLDMIEESASKGVEENFQDYIRSNLDVVNNEIEQFALVLKLLKELKKED